MTAALLMLLLALTPYQTANRISDAKKKEFIKLLRTLPFEGEFYTEEAVEKAGPYLPVLFAITEKDIKTYDIYPFAAISRGLFDQKRHRDYAVRHFSGIRHPVLKLLWASMLFDEAGAASPEIVQFLKDALGSNDRTKVLSQIVGPNFENFRRRVMSHPSSK
jgi:hypothetical protein